MGCSQTLVVLEQCQLLSVKGSGKVGESIIDLWLHQRNILFGNNQVPTAVDVVLAAEDAIGTTVHEVVVACEGIKAALPNDIFVALHCVVSALFIQTQQIAATFDKVVAAEVAVGVSGELVEVSVDSVELAVYEILLPTDSVERSWLGLALLR